MAKRGLNSRRNRNSGGGRARNFDNGGSDLAMLQSILDEPPFVRLASGVSNRAQQIMTWRLPNGTSVQMYINPENFSVTESKQITPVRTKGGFVVQYWGENLARATLSGTTGSAGVKGIQVLRDVYRAEHHAFELVAQSKMEELIDLLTDNTKINEANMALTIADHAKQLRERNFILRPSLASLALNMKLFYQGIQYKGYFTEFAVTESISKLGLFDYNLSFMVTEIRGSRKNFMPWHKEPLADDLVGQLITGSASAVGNAIRNLAGLPRQSENPEQYHPENSPLSFGGSVSGV